MRKYYARFLLEVRHRMFLFWKGQVAVGLVAGVITAIIDAHIGAAPNRIAIASVVAVAGGYLMLLGIFLILAVICVPVTLDRQREVEIAAKESSINANRTRIAELEGLLSKKHPHDEHNEAEIRKALTMLTSQGREAITRLLDAGEMRRGQLKQLGLDADDLFERSGFPPLLRYRSFSPGNGTIELDRFYYINPNMVESLRNVLYPIANAKSHSLD